MERMIGTFNSQESIAVFLVANLCDIPPSSVQTGAKYMTDKLGNMCFVTITSDAGVVTVDISGHYVMINGWKFQDPHVDQVRIYNPIVQVRCEVFLNGFSYSLDHHSIREEFKLGILYIDPFEFARRIHLSSEINLNPVTVPNGFDSTRYDFYSCSWQEVADVALEKDQGKKANSFVKLVSQYVRVLDLGIRQCGFEPDRVLLVARKAHVVNPLSLNMPNLHSANPPSTIREPQVEGLQLNAENRAIVYFCETSKIIDEALSFENNIDLRHLLLSSILQFVVSSINGDEEGNDEATDIFQEISIRVREHYNCGKRIIRFIDRISQIVISAFMYVIETNYSPKVRQFICNNQHSESLSLREMCRSIEQLLRS